MLYNRADVALALVHLNATRWSGLSELRRMANGAGKLAGFCWTIPPFSQRRLGLQNDQTPSQLPRENASGVDQAYQMMEESCLDQSPGSNPDSVNSTALRQPAATTAISPCQAWRWIPITTWQCRCAMASNCAAMLHFRHANVGTSSLNTIRSSSRLILPVLPATL